MTYDIVAVMTTFSPTKLIENSVNSVLSQVDKLVIIDDSGTDSLKFLISNCNRLNKLFDNIDIITNPQNLGIATSLNIASAYAMQKYNPKYMLTLDDDTILDTEYVEKLLDKLEVDPSIAQIVASRHGLEQYSGKMIDKSAVITSGCIMPSRIFTEIGYFDEDFFIDLVDFDFSIRCSLAGYKVMSLDLPLMSHKVGELTIRYGMCIYNHAPFRIYYQTRNALYFFKKYYYKRVKLSVSIILDLFRIPFKIIIFEGNKNTRLQFYLLGIKDAVSGFKGKLRDFK